MALGDHMHTDITEGAAQPFARRGACPTLSRPMPTGDGLLARLRPRSGILDIDQFESLARAAARYGNGLLEITARGSLQIRGLRQETVDPLATAIDAAGIVVLPSPAIELSPLHGAGFGDLANAAAMELQLRQQLADLVRSPGLAPKLALIIDGGGRFGLADVTADIRLLAVSSRAWQVAIAGDGRSAHTIAIGTAEEAILAVGELLRLLLSSGGQRRCREIPYARLRQVFPAMGSTSLAGTPGGKAAGLGMHQSAGGTVVVGLRPRFGQMSANDLIAFLASVRALGVKEIRPAPDRCFFLTGLLPDRAPIVLQHAHQHGLSSDSQDMSAQISTCAGAGACASSFYATKTMAEAVIDICPDLLDGSLAVHLSGCAKGCAHPRPALTLAGTAGGYNLVLNGLASDAPHAQIAGSDIKSAIERLARLIKNERQAGESARACLGRLGKENITQALRQE